MIDSLSPKELVKADYLVRKFGFENLGFTKCHFDVRKDNKKVINYHKMMGAVQVGETELDLLFECERDSFYKAIKKLLNY